MRFSRISVLTAIAVLAGVTGGIATAGTASAAAPVPLDLPGYSHLVVDGPHGHVFVSGGQDSTGIAVTDVDGNTVATVAGEPGATSMALSPDGGTLYVALPGSDAVSAVDTATLTETARYSTGTGTLDDPQSVAYAGGRIWFGYGPAGRGGIGSIDTSGAQPVVSLHDGGSYAAPVLASSPAAPGTLVAGDGTTGPSGMKVYDVSSGTPVITATRTDGGSFIQDMTITPDGKDVLVASQSPSYQQVFKLSDLSDDGTYPTKYYPDAVAVAPDGMVAAGVTGSGPDVYVFRAGGQAPLHTFDVSADAGNTALATAGLAWAPDDSRLFTVTTDVYGGQPALHVLYEPLKAASTITLSPPAWGYPYEPATISGQLTSDDAFAAGQALHVTRTDPAHQGATALPDVPVAADGTFSFTDTPTVTGGYAYTVTYQGDAGHSGDTRTAPLGVGKAPATVVLDGPASAAGGSAVRLTGTMTSPAAFAPGQVVHIGRKDPSGTVKLPDAAVAADGTFSFTDTPRTGGIAGYTATYDGDVSHVPNSALHEVRVSLAATAVSVTADTANYAYGATAKITAHLGTTYSGRTLSVYAQPYGSSAKTLITTGTVDAHGNLSVGYPVTRRTAFTAAFAGDSRYAPAASAARYVWSYARVSDGLRGYYTSAVVGGTGYRIYHHTADPVAGAVIAPAKSGECVAFTAQIWRGSWQDVATAGCLRTSSASSVWATLKGSHLVGYHYRFRTEYVRSAADLANLNTYGGWQYFLFRT
jgi:YVTN family beta-propeller protein